MKGLKLALGTLTIIPVGDLGQPDRNDARNAMLLAPVAALPLACLVTVLLWLAHAAEVPPLVAGFLVVGAIAYGTRAMHIDGLADTVDGFGAGWDRERAVTVMKSGDIGPMGVAALVVVMATQSAAAGSLMAHPWLVGVLVAVSRCGCTAMATVLWPSARPDGMGALMAGTISRPIAGVMAVCAAVVLAVAVFAAGLPIGQGLLAAGVMFVGWFVLGRQATRVFGGVSGDVFGAAVELAFTILLVVFSAGGAA